MDDLPTADLPAASFDLPSVDELNRAVESGQRITSEDASMISHAESELTGCGPVHGGPAGVSHFEIMKNKCVANESSATAQSLAMKQTSFDNKLDEISSKPQSHITQDDARALQSTEVGSSFLLR